MRNVGCICPKCKKKFKFLDCSLSFCDEKCLTAFIANYELSYEYEAIELELAKDIKETKKRGENIKKEEGHALPKAKNKNLSSQELKYLIETAESHIKSNNLQQALKYYTQLIENTPPHPHYFKKRAWVYRMIGEFDYAINDMNKAIDLNLDDGNSYWERGACYAHKLSLEKNIERNSKKQILRKILQDYKDSVKRNPTSSEAWLAIIETDMLLHNWDDAISNYGTCKPYIDTKEYHLVRSWLGCLALTFAGDLHEEEDKTPFYDKNIRLKRTQWCVSEIDSLLIELENEGFDKEKINKAKEFHQEFLDHFVEPPMRFNL